MRPVFRTIQILLIMLAVWAATDTVRTLQAVNPTPVPAPANKVAASESPGPAVRKPKEAYIAISRRNLFNTPETAASQEVPDIDVSQLKTTKLNLVLWGTVFGSNDDSYAVIEDPRHKRQMVYRVGDVVQDAIVRMILREKIVLSVNGRDEVLVMQETFEPGSKRTPAGTTRLPPASARPHRTETPGEPDRAQLIPLPENFGDQLPEDLSMLAQHGKWLPLNDNTGTRGIQLNNMVPGSFFIRLGLKNGDILTDIDGATPAGPEDIQELIETLKVYPAAEVTLLRNGKSLTIRYAGS